MRYSNQTVKNIAVIVFFGMVLLITGCTTTIKNAKITNVTPEQLHSMMQNKDFTLIDVHIPEQRHINGTDLVIPYNELEMQQSKLPKDKSAKIVVYCRSGHMSKTASDELAKMGYTNIYDLQGGRNAWVAKGYDE